MAYWHQLGVDGFRLDAVSHYVEDFENLNFENANFENADFEKGIQTNSAKNFEFCKELVGMITEISKDLVTIAEINPQTSKEEMQRYADIFHLVMNFKDEYLGEKFIDFVNNHDKERNNDIVLFEKKMKVNSPFIIYYGDEIGLQNEKNILNLQYPEIRDLYRTIMPSVFSETQKKYLDKLKSIILEKKLKQKFD